MRFVIYGLGAVGGVVGGALADSGRDVVAVARGGQLNALRGGPLTLHTPKGTKRVPIDVVSSIGSVDLASDDIILVTVKSQDTAAAATDLADVADVDTAVVSLQNGVANEHTLMRYFKNVYGAVVMMPATFVEPGEVSVYGEPFLGTIDVGRYPSGIDATVEFVTSSLRDAGFDSQLNTDIMRWKYGKLLGNLTNSIEAVCGLGTRNGELGRLIVDEGVRVLAAAGIDYASEAEEDERRAGNIEHDEAAGVARRGASSWQSIARGSGSIETAYLNGEISLLGRLHGLPTPANDLIQRTAAELAKASDPERKVPESEILSRLNAS
jgi:2-dehydropantoate 2-reductase